MTPLARTRSQWDRLASRLRQRPAYVLVAATAVAVALALLLLADRAVRPTLAERAHRWQDVLAADARQLVTRGALARTDGSVYTVDIAQLMTWAAMRQDRELYVLLRQWLTDHVLVLEPGDPFSAYFVAWRWRENEPLDASGTTEALRFAEALWTGGHAFDEPEDRDLAVRVVEAYLRHSAVDQDIWLVRNYFNLQTRAFATNSYLVDYDPDLLHNIGVKRDHEAIRAGAAASAALVEASRTPAGLLHSIIQPELRTLMPAGSPIFSPNAVEQLANVAAVAERSVVTRRDSAEEVLSFTTARLPELMTYYNAMTGEAVGEEPAGQTTLAPLLRLAVRLESPAGAQLMDMMIDDLDRQLPGQELTGDDLYRLSEVLLALQTYLHASP